MRVLFIAVVFLLIRSVSPAAAAPFHAGVERLSVAGDVAFDVLAWYPTEAQEVPWRIGPFPIDAGRDAAPAPGRFPVVLLSHGGGPTGGSPLVLRDLATVLARQGFIVIAPFHGKSRLPRRTAQIKVALAAVLADPRLASAADPERLGMIGFSLGGAVTLELAGAIPDSGYFEDYCRVHPEDAMSCDHAPGGDGGQEQPRPPRMPPPRLPLKALVLLDPLAALFPPGGLAGVTMPVLLFRPQQSALPGEANALGLAAALPRPAKPQIVPGGHFVFADVCPADLAATEGAVCRDPPGVDRAAVHAAVIEQVASFLHEHL